MKIKAKLTAIYELCKPTKTSITQRIMLKKDSGQRLFINLFNNVDLLNGFTIGDYVEIEFETRTNIKHGISYENHYLNSIKKPEIEMGDDYGDRTWFYAKKKYSADSFLIGLGINPNE
jgi:hypothetical protein